MNVHNGHLVKDLEVLKGLNLAEEDYTPVPEELEGAAQRKLAGRDQAQVSMNSGGKLSRWARRMRKAQAQSERPRTRTKERERRRRQIERGIIQAE